MCTLGVSETIKSGGGNNLGATVYWGEGKDEREMTQSVHYCCFLLL